MSQNISPQAASAREQARSADGKFGTQPHDKASIELAPAEGKTPGQIAHEERLARSREIRERVRVLTAARQKATDENPVIGGIEKNADGTRDVTLEQATAYAESIDSDDARLVARLTDEVDENGDDAIYVERTGELHGYTITEDGTGYLVSASGDGHLVLTQSTVAATRPGDIEFTEVAVAPDGTVTATGTVTGDEDCIDFEDVEVFGRSDAPVEKRFQQTVAFLGSKNETEGFADEVLAGKIDEYELEHDPQSYYGVPRADRR